MIRDSSKSSLAISDDLHFSANEIDPDEIDQLKNIQKEIRM